MMVLRRAIHLLSLCVAAGLCVSAATAQSGSAKKPATKSSSSSSSAKGKIRKTTRKKKERGQQAPTSDRIAEIQTALSKDGSYKGAPNGKWDAQSVEAMKNFQAAHGLNPSGKFDALTLQKLGLGSETAGVAAPVIPPNATSRLVSSNSQASRD
jgi:peptidoglycan hydrolase-like protein with peptidoglycan-binding domain